MESAAPAAATKPARTRKARSSATTGDTPTGRTEKDVWIAIGELRQSDKQQAAEIATIKHDLGDLAAQASQHTAQLASIEAKLAALPAIQAAFDAWQQARHEEAARAERRARAMSAVLAKNTSLVAGLFGLVVASILQRLGAIPVPALIGVALLLGAYFIVDAVRTFGPHGATA